MFEDRRQSMRSVSWRREEYREGYLDVERQMRSYKIGEIGSDNMLGVRTCFLRLWSISNQSYRDCGGLKPLLV